MKIIITQSQDLPHLFTIPAGAVWLCQGSVLQGLESDLPDGFASASEQIRADAWDAANRTDPGVRCMEIGYLARGQRGPAVWGEALDLVLDGDILTTPGGEAVSLASIR